MNEDVQPDFVSVRYGPDDEYMGRLYVHARFGGFEGRAEAWIDRLQLSEFAERLRQYPLNESPVAFSGGIGAPSEYLEFVGLSASPRGGKGQIIVRVHLASDTWTDGKPVIVHEVTIEFPTSYEFLRRFSAEVHAVLDGASAEARLDVDVLV